MKTIFFVSISIGILGICRSASSETIPWGMTHLPPGFIAEGTNTSEGTANIVMAEIRTELKGYSHSEISIIPNRVNLDFKEGKNFCSPILFKTPDRLDIAVFTKYPSFLTPARGLIVRKDRKSEFTTGDQVAFEDMLAQGKFSGMLSQGRKYGKEIDEVVEKHKGKFKFRAAADQASGLYEMVIQKKVDFTIGAPHELSWFAKDWKDKEALILIPLKELSTNQFSPVYIGCTKNEWGKKIIAEIDKAMEKLVKTKRYEEAPLRWMNDSPNYRSAYKKLVLEASN